jgi:Tfp pilus assembly protein FimT
MAIIALGAVLMVPNIGAWLPNYRLRSAARDVVSAMRVAQMKAVARNVDHRVTFDPGKRCYFIERRRTPGGTDWDKITVSDEVRANEDDVKQSLPDGIQFDAVNFGENKNNAEFNPNSTASGGNVVLKNSKGTQRTIRVLSATGRVRIE